MTNLLCRMLLATSKLRTVLFFLFFSGQKATCQTCQSLPGKPCDHGTLPHCLGEAVVQLRTEQNSVEAPFIEMYIKKKCNSLILFACVCVCVREQPIGFLQTFVGVPELGVTSDSVQPCSRVV